jgi:hypothetical protein
MAFRLTNHAREEVARRTIPADILQATLDNPEQIITEREHRKAYQSRHTIHGKISRASNRR